MMVTAMRRSIALGEVLMAEGEGVLMAEKRDVGGQMPGPPEWALPHLEALTPHGERHPPIR